MGTREMLKKLGEDIVDEAFSDLFSMRIPSATAKKVLGRFSRRWRDYTRAALMVMSCQAVGGDSRVVRQAAKALVLCGGAFDLHDDIIDKSFARKKRRIASIQGIYGMEATLLAGDALLIAGLSMLSEMPDVPKSRAQQAVNEIRSGLFELGSAEMEELSLVRNLNSNPRRYLHIVHMKAADVEAYTKVGAMLGGGNQEECEALGRYGRHLGEVCIIRDDLEDTFNDDWELRSRICKESLPLPIIFSLKDERCRRILLDMFSKSPEDISKKELTDLISVIDENRGFERGQELIQKHVRMAKREVLHLRDPEPFLALFH